MLTPTPAVPADPFQERPGLVIETIGALRLRLDGRDLTGDVLRHRFSAYLWLYLLVRHLAGQAAPIRRSTLAGEVVLDRPDRERLPRLRRLLHDLQRQLPEPLSNCLGVSDDAVGFALSDETATDVGALRGLVVEARSAHFDGALVAVAEAWLRRWAGAELLPDFEVLEEDALNGGPGGELVVALREEVRTLQGDLAVAVAEHRIRRREALSAIAVLEPLAEEGRDDIDRLLIQACMEAGQTTRAAALRRRRPASMEV